MPCSLAAAMISSSRMLPPGWIAQLAPPFTTTSRPSLGLPAVAVLVWVVIAIEVLGGLALILGYHTRLVAIGLAAFTLLASIAGHAFWAAPVDAAFIAQLLFFKNIAVIGGLLVLASSGAGSISIDGRKAKAE